MFATTCHPTNHPRVPPIAGTLPLDRTGRDPQSAATLPDTLQKLLEPRTLLTQDLERNINGTIEKMKKEGWSDKALDQVSEFIQDHKPRKLFPSQSRQSLARMLNKEVVRLGEKVVVRSSYYRSSPYSIEVFVNEAKVGLSCAAICIWEHLPRALVKVYSDQGQASLLQRVVDRTGLGLLSCWGRPRTCCG